MRFLKLPINFQGKLLRVLQERQVRRIGDDKVIDVDARIIAATNKNLRKMVQEERIPTRFAVSVRCIKNLYSSS